ncbi:ribonuclease P protein component [Lysobacter pythonis]|uniref:Ribonuclease P protein component n=1 Tax=Solilutibacter pythonis TaxID=2483112 RepID=A0A3M2I1L1_9GAMM|nr:ribonuclease P protein component [Lysobacter pythonis]RMH93850.1 ribonuclease P protein component [Lysobacter pythonis]
MNEPAPARFCKTARVRSRTQYARVFESARRFHHSAFTLHRAPVEAGIGVSRLGLAVSRKVDPRAVGRNRIKRVLRETFRRLHARMPAFDWVIVVKPVAATMDNAALAAALIETLRRAGALPASDATCTMHAAFLPSPPNSEAAPSGRPDMSTPE